MKPQATQKPQRKKEWNYNTSLCSKHFQNIAYKFCEDCKNLICDKCIYEEHSTHKIVEITNDVQSNTYWVQLLKKYKIEIKEKAKNLAKACGITQGNSDNKKLNSINAKRNLVFNYFQTQAANVEKSTQDWITKIKVMQNEIIAFINLFKTKFTELFSSVEDKNTILLNSIHELDTVIDHFMSQQDKEISVRNLDFFMQFLEMKKSIDMELKNLWGLFRISKSSWISQFSLKESYKKMTKLQYYLDKEIEELRERKGAIDIEKMIRDIWDFDESTLLSQRKQYQQNVLPKDNSIIYQPIDKSMNFLNMFNAETKEFKRLEIEPCGLEGFIFLPYTRSINFCGAVFLCGGYELNNPGNLTFMIEQADNWTSTDVSLIHSPFLEIHDKLFEKVPTKNISYDMNNNIRVTQLSNMYFERAGHSLVGIIPNWWFAIGGVNNNKTCEIFILDENRWEEINPWKESRIDSTTFIYHNHWYAFGGWSYNWQLNKYIYSSTIERICLLDPQHNQWEYLFPKLIDCFFTDMEKVCCGVISKNKETVYIVGGQFGKEKYSDDIIELNINSFTLRKSEKKWAKPTAFLENNFSYLYKIGWNFDYEGDVWFYDNVNDEFTWEVTVVEEVKKELTGN